MKSRRKVIRAGRGWLLAAWWAAALMMAEGWADAQSAAPATGQATTSPSGVRTANATKLEFDVASVKPSSIDERPDVNVSVGPGDRDVPNGGNFVGTDLPLIVYINFAYAVTANQDQAIQKRLPGWAMAERYDITAKTDNHNATKGEMRLMMRSLLANRFKLAVHSETDEVPVYALLLAKPGVLGPKLVVHPANAPCSATIPKPSEDAKTPPPDSVAGGFPLICGDVLGMPPSAPGMFTMGARNVTVDLIASTLATAGKLERPVLNRTGLTGKYDFLLEFAPELRSNPNETANSTPQLDTPGPGIEEALKQQLGLKLKSEKGPVDVWIVDHVEQPSPN